MIRVLLIAGLFSCTGPEIPVTRVCEYTQDASSCCGACPGAQWCSTKTCRCEDVIDPCSASSSPGNVATGTTPDPGPVPSGTVTSSGGTVERLWFATTGDTRPGSCDATNAYPTAAITQIAKSMKALKVQFTVDLGDHMYVCNESDPEAVQQMGFYTTAIANGPSTWFMTMGNHECGSYSCYVGGAHDANFSAYMNALKRPLPYYSYDVQTNAGLARFVLIADDSWDATQQSWLQSTLTDADTKAKYTIIARHHPMTGSRTGNSAILSTIQAHKYSLLLTAHNHDYEHDTSTWGGRYTVVGLGGASPSVPPGFATVLQNTDGTLSFVVRDAVGNPIGAPWTVQPQ